MGKMTKLPVLSSDIRKDIIMFILKYMMAKLIHMIYLAYTLYKKIKG